MCSNHCNTYFKPVNTYSLQQECTSRSLLPPAELTCPGPRLALSLISQGCPGKRQEWPEMLLELGHPSRNFIPSFSLGVSEDSLEYQQQFFFTVLVPVGQIGAVTSPSPRIRTSTGTRSREHDDGGDGLEGPRRQQRLWLSTSRSSGSRGGRGLRFAPVLRAS